MTGAVVAFTRRGAALGRRIAETLFDPVATVHVSPRLGGETGLPGYESLEAWTAWAWENARALVFVGAAGIAVRAAAPHLADKWHDPCVVSVDEAGRFAVPLAGGHVGGANRLAEQIAALTGGQAVISTATDVNGIFAVDGWAADEGLSVTDRTLAKTISAALLEGRAVGFVSDWGHPCPAGLAPGDGGELGIWVTCRTGPGPFRRTLRLAPRCLTLGIGCRRGVSEEQIQIAVDEALEGLEPDSVYQTATLDRKGDEAGLLAFCRRRGLSLRTFSPAELAEAEGEFSSSLFVKQVTGVDNVCERAAVLAGGPLLVPRQARDGVTVAVAGRIRG